MPISIALAKAQGFEGADLLQASLVPVGAVLGGAIFGDHASPISDTTILSSTGAGCPHLEHVATQVPYALFIAICALAGHIAGGLTLSVFWAWIAAGAVFALGLYILPKLFPQK